MIKMFLLILEDRSFIYMYLYCCTYISCIYMYVYIDVSVTFVYRFVMTYFLELILNHSRAISEVSRRI